jgi:hypothetical protein
MPSCQVVYTVGNWRSSPSPFPISKHRPTQHSILSFSRRPERIPRWLRAKSAEKCISRLFLQDGRRPVESLGEYGPVCNGGTSNSSFTTGCESPSVHTILQLQCTTYTGQCRPRRISHCHSLLQLPGLTPSPLRSVASPRMTTHSWLFFRWWLRANIRLSSRACSLLDYPDGHHSPGTSGLHCSLEAPRLEYRTPRSKDEMPSADSHWLFEPYKSKR